MKISLGFWYTDRPGGVCIHRVLTDTPAPVLPAQIAGAPLVEIGRYCFAEREVIPQDAHFWSTDGQGCDAYPHAVVGNFVERVTLPDTVRVLHSAAFYNCRNLREIEVSPNIDSLGSDLFTNCRALRAFVLRAAPDAGTGLKKLVGAVAVDVTAEFTTPDGLQARLFYPEYSELLDENTPAHIFNRSIEGEGYRYRQCFDGGVLRFAEYDAGFSRACDGETPATLARIALGRLCFPFSLSEDAAIRYRDWLCAHPADAAALVLTDRDPAALRVLLAQDLLDAPTRRDAAQRCGQLGWSEGAALLLGSGKPKRKQYSFDDFDF